MSERTFEQLFGLLNKTTGGEHKKIYTEFLDKLDALEGMDEETCLSFVKTIPKIPGTICGHAYIDFMWQIFDELKESDSTISSLELELARRKAQILDLKEQLKK